MTSHPILPQARRAAIEAAFDEALAEVRAAGDVALLQECRAIFRKRVPLNLRAYVAAALALKGAGASRQSDKRGRNAESGRDERGDRFGREGRGDKRKDDDRKVDRQQAEPKQAPASGKAGKSGREQLPKEVREPRAAAESAETREPREPREVRENRYRGEGVTLFVSAGRRQRFYARIAIKVLLDIPGVADESVGDIRTMDNYSFIVVDPAVEDIVIAGLNGYDFKGRTLAVNRARKRGESAPATEETAAASGADDDDPELDAFGSGGDAEIDSGIGGDLGADGDRSPDSADDMVDEHDVEDDGEGEPEGEPTESA